ATNKQLLLLLGNGDGSLEHARKFRISFEGTGSAAADLNHDGKLDVIVGGTGKVAVLLGNGDGSFQSPKDYGTGDLNDYTFAIADFNGDGNLDVATTGAYGSRGSSIGGWATSTGQSSYSSSTLAQFSLGCATSRGFREVARCCVATVRRPALGLDHCFLVLG